jgi:hypothetical protein
MSRQIDLRDAAGSHGPRLHDLRFASRTFLRWYPAGEDPGHRSPALSAYLEHAHWGDTFWYLSALQELMRAAMSRFERHWEQWSLTALTSFAPLLERFFTQRLM